MAGLSWASSPAAERPISLQGGHRVSLTTGKAAAMARQDSGPARLRRLARAGPMVLTGLLGGLGLVPGLARPDDAAAPPAAPATQLLAALGDAGKPLPEAAEGALRQAAQQALWPADIARLCGDYLRLFPQQPWAAEAGALRQRTLETADLLGRVEVQLFRNAFSVPPEGGPAIDDLRRAALGDRAAALRLAHQAQGLPGGERRRVGWWQYAALLGSGQAAYALALHYRRESQPLLAAQYEARAIELGYLPPPALGHRR
jgi:hypothetical protein